MFRLALLSEHWSDRPHSHSNHPGCRIVGLGKGIFLPYELLDELKAIAKAKDTSGPPSSPRAETSVDDSLLKCDLGLLLLTTQEIVVLQPHVALALRPTIGEWRCARH